jgi:hypothetical protein
MEWKLAFSPEEAAAALGLGRTAIFEALRDGRPERRESDRRTIIPASTGESICQTAESRTGSHTSRGAANAAVGNSIDPAPSEHRE